VARVRASAAARSACWRANSAATFWRRWRSSSERACASAGWEDGPERLEGAGPRTSNAGRFSTPDGAARFTGPGPPTRGRLVSTTTVLERPWLKLCFTVPVLTEEPTRGFSVRGALVGRFSFSSVMRSLDYTPWPQIRPKPD
jgi:hypothetical protein